MNERAARIAGATMIFAAFATLIAVSHHPVIKTHHGPAVFAEIAQISTAAQVMHASVIALALVLVFAAIVLSRQLQMRTPAVAALTAYAFGSLAWTGAALVDGFFTPAIGARYLHAPADAVQSGIALLVLCGAAIQILSKTGLIATSAAILLWSAALLPRGREAVAVAITGIVSVAFQAAVLAFTGPSITAHTIPLIVGGQALWYLAAGIWLTRITDPS